MTSRKAWTAGLLALAVWSPAVRAQPGAPPIPPIGGLAGGAGGASSALGAGGGLAGGLGGRDGRPADNALELPRAVSAAICKLARPSFAPARSDRWPTAW